MSMEIYNRQGEPISEMEFNRLLGLEVDDDLYRRVASTVVGSYWVSTVWLGLNHRFLGDGPPIIFETMVFSNDEANDPDREGLHEFDMVRYCTEEEALAGHEEMCTLI